MRYVYRATVARVVDGDTVDLTVDLGLRITTHLRVRLLGINAPERGKPGGDAATAALRTWLPSGASVTVQTFKDPGDKYGRWLGTVTTADGADVGDEMITTGNAIAYPTRSA